MISSDVLKFLPELNWTEYSKFELNSISADARATLIKNSTSIKIFHHDGDPVLVAGLLRHGLISTPYLWVALTPVIEHLSVSEMRTLVFALREYAGDMETTIMEGNQRAMRFAALFGFRPTEITMEIEGHPFRVWRRTWQS